MFELEWKKSAIKEAYKLETQISSRIYKKVEELKQGFLSKDIKRIKGENKFRLRVGDYRVLFSLENDKIIIWKVGHRKNIYKY